MAAFKIIIVALAAVCLAQAQTTTPAFNQSSALAQAAQASVTMTTAVANANNTLLGYLSTADNLMMQTVANARAQIRAIVDSAHMAALNQSGVNSCVTEKVGEVEGLALTTGLDVVQCATDKVHQLKLLIDSVANLGVQAVNFIPNAIIRINTCSTVRGMFQPGMCYAGESFQMSFQVAAITAGVTGVVATGTGLVSTLQTDLALCASLKVAAFAARAALITGSFAVCAIVKTVC